MLPVVTCESLVTRENLTQGDCLSQKERTRPIVHYQGRCFQQIETFSTGERLSAYSLACEMAEKGVQILVTASKIRYIVWAGS